ncbi:CDP-alcohol phosphatidyltransferase family protein [Sorangium sp. So ce327]|uniref:CDP-alcohol phosphatidyltransferase family protein n=1 Tax=Sorangium sp. So ce327 TaxID=3133301 RepID=UPI003F5D6635
MPEPRAAAESSTPAAQSGGVPGGWKMRMEDPLNRYYRYPIARWIVRALMRTPVTPNQVTLVQPLFAALAGYLVTFDDPRHLIAGALVFELRSILDCVDGALARAKRMVSPAGHAIDGLADWLGVVFLYAGIFWHVHLHPPPEGPWSATVSTNALLLIALLQGALRSFSADYFKLKYCSIFETGTDETADVLRRKIQALGPSSSFFAHFDVFIGRMGHLAFEHEWFDPRRSRSSTSADQVKQLIREEASPLTRLIGALWAISNGDAFLSMVVLTLLLNQLWLGQVFFATGGVVWIVAVIGLNGWFLRGASRRAKLAVA